MTRSQLKRTILAFEILEGRYFLAASFPIQGWQSGLFDEGVAGDLELSFSRDVPTVDFSGNAVAANQPRFAAEKLVTDTHLWNQVLPHYNNPSIGSGWDHDGTTPLAVFAEKSGSLRVFFVRGDAFSVENVIDNGGDLLGGTVSGYRYRSLSVVVHEGLVVFLAARERWEEDRWIIEGVSFIYTQDYGQTMQRVPQVGGGFDVPPLENNVADGIQRGQTWAFENAFPEKSSADLLGAWFPWADYLYKIDSPKGGQIGLFRARRLAVGQPWVVEPNRLVFERWEPSDAGGMHAHSAGMFDDGLVSFWGDVDYRNHMARHIANDLENYTTTTWIHNTEFNGAWSPDDGKVYRIGNQAASVAPAPKFGDVLVTGDVQPELVMKIQRPDDPDGTAIISNQKGSFPGVNSGDSYAGRISLGIHHLRGRGYVVQEGASNQSMRSIPGIHYSVDGESWTGLLNVSNEFPKLYGDYVVQSSADGIYAAAVPDRAEVFSPLAISPGGTNLSNTTWDEITPPGSGNTFRSIQFIDGEYRYADSEELVLPQPGGPPPVMGTVPIFEVTSEGLSDRLGMRNASDIPSNDGEYHRLDVWYYNLSGDGISPTVTLKDLSKSGASRWVTNNQWVSGYFRGEPVPESTNETGRLVQMFTKDVTSPQRWLMAVGGLVEHHSPTYPLAPESTGPHELATLSGFQIAHDWTLGLVFGIPELGGFSGWLGTTGSDAVHPIATLRQDPTNYIEVGFYRLSQWSQFIVLDVYSDGVFAGRLEFPDLSLDFEDRVHLAISGSEDGLGASLLLPRNSIGVQSTTMDELSVIRPQEVLLSSNAAQDVVSTLEWYAVQVLPDKALTNQEREAFVMSDEIFSPAVGPPRVTSVKVGSTDWHPAFVSWVDPLDHVGYDIRSGNSQQTPLPWSNINQIFVEFSEDVQIEASDIQLAGIDVQNYETQVSFSYDKETSTATLTLDHPLQADQLKLHVSDTVTDLTGKSLDGEWINQHSDFASGDETAGGNFIFCFNVLPGDVFRDGVVLANDITLATLAQFTTPGDADYSIFADLDGNGMVFGNDLQLIQLAQFNALPDVPIGTGPPRVRNVKVNSTTWDTDFVSLVDPTAGVGYAVPTGTAQLAPLPWVNIDQILIEFSEDVQIDQADIQLMGIANPDYTAVAELNYDHGSRTATLTLENPIEADRLRLVVADSVTDQSGEALDGDWTTQSSTFESGNDSAGGDFIFEFNVLPGDVSQDEWVLGNDVTLATNAQFSDRDDQRYSVFADLDGNVVVLGNDIALSMQHQFSTLPPSLLAMAAVSVENASPDQAELPIQTSPKLGSPVGAFANGQAKVLAEQGYEPGSDINNGDLLLALFDEHDYLAKSDSQASDVGELASESGHTSREDWELVTATVFEDYFTQEANEG